MPKEKEINHPCHLLSLPSAKRFWCRHCMTVFEDAITRWRHSRSCRYGVVNNFMRWRELEAKALQNTSVLNPVEARLEQSIQMYDLASSSTPVETDSNNEPQLMPGPESFNCFICHQRFASMEEMRVHVKYPCSNSKIITSCAPHPRHSMPVFIDTVPGQTSPWHLPSQHLQNVVHQTGSYVSAETQQQLSTQTSYDIDIQSQQEMESQYDDTSVVYDNSGGSTADGITPTNIYVNEQGETVIEVENLDLNSEGGELSLAHLLTQLSQQGIVFDKSRSAQLQAQHEITVSGDTTSTLYTTEVTYQQVASPSVEEEEGQPTAEDAANTLAQLAGFRGFNRIGQTQSDGETQLISQVETYSYNNSSSGPSKQDIINAHPPIDITYEYEYSDPLSSSDQSSATAQQITIQQAIVSDSQEYDHVNVEHTAAEETIQYYSDSSNVAYVTDPSSQHHVQMHSNAIPSLEDMKHNGMVNDAAESVLIQHYPVHVNASGQLIIAPNDASAHHMHETQAEYVLSEEPKAGDVEIIISDVPEGSTLISNFNSNSSSQNIESCVLTLEHPLQSQNIADSDEFTTQTIALQEIEDSDTKSLTVVGEKLIPQVSDSHFANTNHDLQTTTGSFEKQTAQYKSNSLVDSAVESYNTGRPSDTLLTGKTEDFSL